MARAVGIDLGTTNSVVALLEGGEPSVIANAEGAQVLRPVIFLALLWTVWWMRGSRRPEPGANGALRH